MKLTKTIRFGLVFVGRTVRWFSKASTTGTPPPASTMPGIGTTVFFMLYSEVLISDSLRLLLFFCSLLLSSSFSRDLEITKKFYQQTLFI